MAEQARIAEPPATPPDGAAAAPPAAQARPGGDRSTHFAFAHRIFAVKGAFFALSDATEEPVYNVDLGELKAALTLPTLAREFSLHSETDDGKLLEVVEKGLRYVKIIRPGDSIPREILDGTSSWSVEPVHEETARARLLVSVAAWASDEPPWTSDPHRLRKLATDPEIAAKAEAGMGRLAARVGLADAAAVRERVEALARELAYIEALRARVGKVQSIERKLADAGRIYRNDRTVAADLQRIQALFRAPVAELEEILDAVDAQSGDVASALKGPAQHVEFVRAMRDDINQKLLKWDEIVARWEKIPAERGAEIESEFKRTYQFVARHFPQRSTWSLRVKQL
jgi:hypothetical protein